MPTSKDSPQERTKPERGRPHLPGYGIAKDKDGLLAWDWVDAQMAKSRNYWVCSTRPDGRPHAAPVWGVWLDGTLYFGSSRQSRKTRNFEESPEVAVHLESGDEAVMLEGVVEQIEAKGALFKRIADAYGTKYPPYKPDPQEESDAVYYALRPRVAMAWLESDFVKTATRWKF